MESYKKIQSVFQAIREAGSNMLLTKFRKLISAAAILTVTSFSAATFSEGTETLGPLSIDVAEGSGVAIGGVGLFIDNMDGTYTNTDGEIDVSVPPGASIEQVLLYWVSEDGPSHVPVAGDDMVTIDGNPVVGTLIGGTSEIYAKGDGTGKIYMSAYRADITGLGLVSDGDNTLLLTEFDATYRNQGAGILVIFDDGSGADIELLDGLDFAYHKLAAPLDAVVPQTINFAPSTEERFASVPFFVGSVGADRPNVTEITSGGVTTEYFDLFTSSGGPQWDSVLVPVIIPANADSITIEILSAAGPDIEGNPASFDWIVGGVAIEDPEIIDCNECDGKVTQLTMAYLGDVAATITVVQKKDGDVVYDAVVEPGGTFTFTGTDNGTLSTEIEIFINGGSNAKIHTSCSKPIGPGLIAGLFEVVEGYSKNGGLLCEPILPPPSEGDCECDGKVTQLTFEYTGPGGQVVISQKDGEEVFNAYVNNGDNVSISGVDDKGTLSTEINIFVDGTCYANIHTSCSRPIGAGLVAGDFTVISGFSRNGGELCNPVAADAQDTACKADKPKKGKKKKAKKPKGKKKGKKKK